MAYGREAVSQLEATALGESTRLVARRSKMTSQTAQKATDDHSVGIHLRAFNWHLWKSRTRLGYTQHQLAELAGIYPHKISEFETLKLWPSYDQADDLAAILGVDVGVLFPDALRERCANVPASVRFRVPLTALPAPEEPDLLEAPLNFELRAALAAAVGTLTPREQKVLRLRFGLNGGESQTLEEVGKEFNVTRNRIRQIEQKALRKLRHPSRSKKLRDYLE